MVAAFWKLGSVPRAFDGDEAAFGYYASSLVEHGTDEYGNRWPVYFKSIGDYKLPGYSYLSMLPVKVLGLSVFSTRFLSALAGVVTLLLLIKLLEDNNLLPKKMKWLVIMGVVLATLSTWFLVFSRAAKEANLGLALMMFSVYGFSKCMSIPTTKKGENLNKWMILSFVSILLSGMSYVAYKVLGLGWIVISGLIVKERKDMYKRWWIGSLITALLIFAMMINPLSRVRSGSLILTSNGELWNGAQSQIWEVGMSLSGKPGALLARTFDNKLITIGWDAMRRYFSHFDASFLFVNGNPNLPWYNVPKVGMLMTVTIPFILLGVYELFRNLKNNWLYKAMFGWLIIAPITSALAVFKIEKAL